MQTVAVVGVGLIGGSFALALKDAGFDGRILGVSSPATIAAALQTGAIDEAAPLQQAAQRADLVYLAQPISQILNTIAALNPWVRPGALVTDAGSTKTAIVNRAREALTRCQFLGGHPLAGKESRGVESADAALFRGRTYVLTPQSDEDLITASARAFTGWLERIGAQLLVTTAEHHDEVVAYTSHLPQLASTALASCVAGLFPEELPQVWGPGLVDSTRLALSAFEIWGDILDTNRNGVDAALGRYIKELQRLRDLVGKPEMRSAFERAGMLARRLRESA